MALMRIELHIECVDPIVFLRRCSWFGVELVIGRMEWKGRRVLRFTQKAFVALNLYTRHLDTVANSRKISAN